jgi:hypothetical protein
VKSGNYCVFHAGYLVIKNIAYFPSQCARNSGPVLGAVLDWFQAAGIQTQENSWHSDAAVIWSVLWHGRMAANQQVYEHYRQQGKPVVVIEVGALYRGQTWKIAVNNINSYGYYGHLENLDWDRPKKLGISLAINLSNNPGILIAAQHGQSLQLEGLASQELWIANTIQQLRQTTDRPVHIRPHPRYQLNWNQPTDIHIEQPVLKANTYDSFDIHFDYHAVINYSSGPGIQAAIAGTRTIVNHTSLAYPVSVDINDIEKPYGIDRQQWLTEICHTEYTVDELKRGTWLKRIAPALA